MSLHTAVGGILSFTVTVAVQVLLFALLSVTVSVTVLTPMSAQVKLVSLIDKEAMPQAALEMLSISAAVICT